MKNYIEKIKQILAKTGWSQSRFAQEVGVTFASVNRWLKGHTKPHLTQLKQIDILFKKIIGIVPLTESKLKQIITEVEKKKKHFPKITKILQEEKAVEEFLLELTYNSDAIEGSALTKKQTEAIIFDKATVKEKSLVEHLEAVNHAAILKDIFSGKYLRPINESLVKEMHAFLMQGIRDDAGEYSKQQRAIRGVDLILPGPDDILEEMSSFFDKVNSNKKHPIKQIAKMHADFEAIHPFGDGNGRIGRLIMVIQLINNGYAPCVITVVQRAKYYECLEYSQKRSETHLVHFLAESILRGYQIIDKTKI